MQTKKYFNLLDLLKEHDIELTGSQAFFINGPRNCGKSYNAWEIAKSMSLTAENKLMYIRNKDITLNRYKNEFNAANKSMLEMTATNIFNMQYDKEYKKFKRNDLVGYVSSINTYETAKSLTYDAVNFMIYDEFNTKDLIPDIYWKFINIITSVIRNKEKFTIIALANRDNENCPFSVNLGTDDFELSRHDQIKKVFDEQGLQIYWIELGFQWVENVGNDKTLYYALAQFDSESSKYMDGNYAIKKPKTVLNFKTKIESTYKPLWGFYFQQQKYFYGTFIYNGTKCFAICTNSNVETDEINKFYNFDKLSRYMSQSIDIDDDDTAAIIEALVMQIKNKLLYFDSFNMKIVFDLII